MVIDEQELLKLSGSRPSDHNTISVEINIPKIQFTTKKKEIWKINKNTKWAEYRRELVGAFFLHSQKKGVSPNPPPHPQSPPPYFETSRWSIHVQV